MLHRSGSEANSWRFLFLFYFFCVIFLGLYYCQFWDAKANQNEEILWMNHDSKFYLRAIPKNEPSAAGSEGHITAPLMNYKKVICKLDLQAGGTYKGRSLRYLNFVLLFSNLHYSIQCTYRNRLWSFSVVIGCFHWQCFSLYCQWGRNTRNKNRPLVNLSARLRGTTKYKSRRSSQYFSWSSEFISA